MQKHLPSAIAVLAPYVNSYRRYVPDFAAPINLEWGRDNRTNGIARSNLGPRRTAGREPVGRHGLATHTWASPASLACGLLGLTEARDPSPEFRGDAYTNAADIPSGLGDAVDIFANATALHDVLGPEFAATYAALKRMEHKAFLQVISSVGA